MAKSWKLVISRWDAEKVQHIKEIKDVDEFSLEYEPQPDEIVTSVMCFTNSRIFHVWTRKSAVQS